MKTANALKIIAATAVTILTGPAFAALELAQDRIVKTDKGVPLKAYPTSNSCKIWYYVPGRLVAEGRFRHVTQLAEAKVGQINQVAYVSNLILNTSPNISENALNELRELIFQFATKNKFCAGTAPANKDDLVLMPADVKIRPTPLQSEQESGQSADFTAAFSGAYPTHPTGSKDAWENSTDPRDVTFAIDATHPSAIDDLKDLISLSNERLIPVGKISFVLKGIVSHISADLEIKANMRAEFESRLETLKCTEVKKQGGSNEVLDGALALASPEAYVAKQMLDGKFPKKSKTTTCNQQLVTTFRGGDITGTFTFNTHDTNFNDEDGQPIMVQPCTERGECENPITLDQYLKYELLTLYLQTNFASTVKAVGDRTFELTLGRRGTSETKVDVSGKYRRVMHGRIVKSIPVFAKNLNESSFRWNFIGGEMFKCATGNNANGVRRYEIQARKYAQFVKTSPMPIADECYPAERSN